jgi:hypothetical protein
MSERSTTERLVFISHAGEDAWVARQIAREVKKRGAEAFLAEAKPVGAEFDEEILGALERTDELVVLLTPWAVRKPYVMMEVGAIWREVKRGKRPTVVVTVLHGLDPRRFRAHPEMPQFLTERTLIILNDIGRYLAELRARVAAGKTNG